MDATLATPPRSRRLRLGFAIFAALLLLPLAPGLRAEAAIDSTLGSIDHIAPPASVRPHQLESNTHIRAFNEQQGVEITGSVLAVDIVNPGTYTANPAGQPTIPLGTVVDSHFLLADPVGTPPASAPLTVQGSVTFVRPVLAIIYRDPKLNQSDKLGATGTAYPMGASERSGRGLELGAGAAGDVVTLSADRLTVTFKMTQHVLDQARLITEAGAPANVTTHILPTADGTDVTFGAVPSGTEVRDQAIVTGDGAIVPTGSVIFVRFDNASCSGTPAATETVALDANGEAFSSPFTTIQGGLSYLVTYSGDATYGMATAICEPLNAENIGAFGCTPGYWKVAVHRPQWLLTGYSANDRYNTVFGRNVFANNPTLLQVLNMGGGDLQALGRHSVAALLNARHPDVDYASTSTQVIALVQSVIDGGANASQVEILKNRLDAQNDRRCPL
jgi:hypothetical protein